MAELSVWSMDNPFAVDDCWSYHAPACYGFLIHDLKFTIHVVVFFPKLPALFLFSVMHLCVHHVMIALFQHDVGDDEARFALAQVVVYDRQDRLGVSSVEGCDKVVDAFEAGWP